MLLCVEYSFHNKKEGKQKTPEFSWKVFETSETKRMEQQTTKLPTLKICMLGQSGVGKSSLVHKFVKDKFSQNIQGTVGGTDLLILLSESLQLHFLQKFFAQTQEK